MSISSLNADVKPASAFTVQSNAAWYDKLDFSDTSEAECATRGLIDAPESLELVHEDGHVIWTQDAYAFLDESPQAPDTANPSLWENAKNNHAYGLFKVIDGIYQVRGYDMANLTLIEGQTGWIVFDCTMTVDCAAACMQLVEKHLGRRPVRAVVISHPHVDHFGGIKALVDEADVADRSLDIAAQVASGKVPIIVPEHFTRHAVAENLYAGGAMGRRACFQYGTILNPGPRGRLSIGIGMGQSRGTVSFITPTWEVRETGETITIDGVTMEFQMTPGTEAPAEMNTWFPQLKALWAAENCTGTLHNLYTLRGAEVRDGNAWANYIMEAAARYGSEVEVVFQSHNWPHWGKDVVNDYLANTAAVYKFINDQTLTYINQGYTSTEIAHLITLPAMLQKNWYTRQYYGTFAHDAKAVYQKYMGWYDANPINLDKLPPAEAARKWVEYLGGSAVALERARADFEAGEYQWVAELTNTIVFAEPDNRDARLLCADALEQLGYQAESGTWRNCYLTAALELRQGNSALKSGAFGADLMANLTPAMVFDYMGILADKAALADESFSLHFQLSDVDESHVVWVRYGALLHAQAKPAVPCDVEVVAPRALLFSLMSGSGDLLKAKAQVTGRVELLDKLLSHLDQLSGGSAVGFNVIEP